MTPSFHRTFGILATAIVLLALVWGFVIIGSPGQERLRKFDEQRVNDLRSINSEILNIVRDWKGYDSNRDLELRRELPKTLQEVIKLARYSRPNIVDPESAASYEYLVKSATQYELCATFSGVREQQYDIFWDHPSGRHCYQFDALEGEGYASPDATKPVPPPVRPL